MRYISDQVVEKNKTHILNVRVIRITLFSVNRAICEIMWKNAARKATNENKQVAYAVRAGKLG